MSVLNQRMRQFEEAREAAAACLAELLETLPTEKRDGVAKLFEHNAALIGGMLETLHNELTPPTGLLSQSVAREGDTRASVRFEVIPTAKQGEYGSRAQAAFSDYLNSIPWREGVPVEHIEACIETLRALFVNDMMSAIDEISITLIGKK